MPAVMSVPVGSASSGVISFHSLVEGSAGVRVTDVDGKQYLWAVDLAMVATGKNNNEAGEVLRRLKSDVFDSSKILEMKLAENHGHKTKLVTFDHALELVMVLPGDTAKAFRVQACDILKRHFAGDSSLHAEIEANAVSIAPINALAQANMPEVGQKRVHEDDDLQQQIKRVEFLQTKMELYKQIGKCPDFDDRAKTMFQEELLNCGANGACSVVDKEPIRRYGFLYCMESDGKIGQCKLGKSLSPETRQSDFNTICAADPQRLRTSHFSGHAIRDERLMHKYFESARIAGELFAVSVADVNIFFDWLDKRNKGEDVGELPPYVPGQRAILPAPPVLAINTPDAAVRVVKEPYRFISTILNSYYVRYEMDPMVFPMEFLVDFLDVYATMDGGSRVDIKDFEKVVRNELNGASVSRSKKRNVYHIPSCLAIRDLRGRNLYDSNAPRFPECGTDGCALGEPGRHHVW